MIYHNTLEFANQLDEKDPLKDFKSQFLVPKHNGNDAIYLCGNSLGLQPVTAQKYINDQLSNWKELAIEGFFAGNDPWLGYHNKLTHTLSNILGAQNEEITVMN